MTPQEIFDTVARHLFTQGERAGKSVPVDDPASDGSGFACQYRGPDGTKCAVGVLIPDAAYTPLMEGHSAVGLFDLGSSLVKTFDLPDWMRGNAVLLSRLQAVHDLVDNWSDDKRMRWELSLVATAFGLDDSILKGLSFNRPKEQGE
jgi:hypothetical protein